MLTRELRFLFAESTINLISFVTLVPAYWALIVLRRRRGRTDKFLVAPSTYTDAEVRRLTGASILGGAGLALIFTNLYMSRRFPTTEAAWLAPLGIGFMVAWALISRALERRRTTEIFRAYDASHSQTDRPVVMSLTLDVEPVSARG